MLSLTLYPFSQKQWSGQWTYSLRRSSHSSVDETDLRLASQRLFIISDYSGIPIARYVELLIFYSNVTYNYLSWYSSPFRWNKSIANRLIRTLISLNAQNITRLWLLIEFETHSSQSIDFWQKHLTPECTIFHIGPTQHAYIGQTLGTHFPGYYPAHVPLRISGMHDRANLNITPTADRTA
jgi:hypothetical protein